MKELKNIFDAQKEFQKNFYDPDDLIQEDKIKFTKEYILSIHKELSEILDTIPWKLHRKENVVHSRTNIVEETIDVFKFLLNICIIWKIEPEEFVKEFFRKSSVVNQRYQQEILNDLKNEKFVCAIDIDDTLANSSEHFIDIYNALFNVNDKKYLTRNEIKDAIPALHYEDIKHYFRESGEKINIPVKPGAKELCDFLKRIGYKIVLISARPYERYARIYSDTLEWLKKNEIQYDALYFERDKHLTILKLLPNIRFMIEDNFKYAEHIAKQGYKVYLLDDFEKTLPKGVYSFTSLFEIIEHIKGDIKGNMNE